jgi:hypothetical protein
MPIKNANSKSWVIKPSLDGNRYSSFPSGDAVKAPTLLAPNMNPSGATIHFTNGSNYTTLVPKYRTTGTNTWMTLASDTTSPIIFTGLVAGSYEFEVWPNGNQSYASNRVTGIVVSNSSVLFTDDFSSGDLSKYNNSFRWGTGGLPTAGTGSTTVFDVTGPLGTTIKARRFQYGTSAGGPEQRFSLTTSNTEVRSETASSDTAYQEICLGYDLYIPSNYSHVTTNSGGVPAYNNKWLATIWKDQYGHSAEISKVWGSVEAWASNADAGKSHIRFIWSNPQSGSSPSTTSPQVVSPTRTITGGNGTAYAVKDTDLGKWSRIVLHFKCADIGATNGFMRIYRSEYTNGVLGAFELMYAMENMDNSTNVPGSPETNGFDRGYIFGYSNSAYPETTTFYLANFAFDNKAQVILENISPSTTLPFPLQAGQAMSQANMPMEIIFPRPDTETAIFERHRLHPNGVPMRIPVGVQGGRAPFRYSVSSTMTGLKIGADLPINWFDNGLGLYGILTHTNPVIGNYTTTITVTDQDSNTASITFNHSVADRNDTTKFRWYDNISGNNTNNGSYDNPYRDNLTLAMGATSSSTTLQGQVWFKASSTPYILTGHSDLNAGNIRLDVTKRPVVFCGAPLSVDVPPGIKISFSSARFHDISGNPRGLFWGDLNCDGSVSSLSNFQNFWITTEQPRITFFSTDVTNIGTGSVGDDNAAFTMFASGATSSDSSYSKYILFRRVREFNRPNSSNSYAITSAFGLKWAVAEDCHTLNSSSAADLYWKDSCQYVTARFCKFSNLCAIGGQNQNGGTTGNIEYVYTVMGNNVATRALTLAHEAAGSTVGPAFVSRCTLKGWLGQDSKIVNGPFRVENSIIQSSSSPAMNITVPAPTVVGSQLHGNSSYLDSNLKLSEAYNSYYGTHGAELSSSPPLYVEDWESATVNVSPTGRGSNGFLWNDAANVTPQLVSRYGGTKSARFRYPAQAVDSGDANSELRFNLGGLYKEVTIEFDLLIPSNYQHRNEASSDNNKFFRLWGSTGANDGYDSPEKIGASLWPTAVAGTSNSVSSLQPDWNLNGQGVGPKGQFDDDFVNATDLGQWRRVKIYCKHATAANNDGVLKIWKDGVLVSNNTAMQNYNASATDHAFQKGYLMGWSNSGFTNQTDFYIDNIKFFVASPVVPNETKLQSILLHNSFENGTVGANINTIAPVSTVNAKISTTRSLHGSRSARDVIAARQSGGMGWYWESADGFPSLTNGDEIWMRLAIYVPTGASLRGNAGSGLKFFRFRQKDSTNTIRNYQDLYYREDQAGNFVSWQMINENSGNWKVLTTNQNARLVKGAWTFVEYYMKLDNTPVSAGGQGRSRLWINGNLVANISDQLTLAGSGWTFFNFLFLTYWNMWSTNPASGEGPDSEIILDYDQWSCAIKSASRDDTPHLATDGGGFKYIGTAVSGDTSSTVGGTPTPILFQNFDTSSLPLGWTNAGGSFELSTNTAQVYGGSGKSLRGIYPANANGNLLGLTYNVDTFTNWDTSKNSIYIRFRARMPAPRWGMKFIKIFGKQGGNGGYANTTFGLDYTGSAPASVYQVSFGDGTTTTNDTQNVINLDGTNKSWAGRSSTTATILTPQNANWGGAQWGDDWHLFEIYVKFNSGDSALNEVADGAYTLKIDGTTYVNASGLFNRHYSNPRIDRIEFFGWTQGASPATPFSLWLDNVEITQDGWGSQA